MALTVLFKKLLPYNFIERNQDAGELNSLHREI